MFMKLATKGSKSGIWIYLIFGELILLIQLNILTGGLLFKVQESPNWQYLALTCQDSFQGLCKVGLVKPYVRLGTVYRVVHANKVVQSFFFFFCQPPPNYCLLGSIGICHICS